MTAEDKRLTVLRDFVRLLEDTQRSPVPDEEEVRQTAASGVVPGSPGIFPWRETVQWLFHQRRLGVTDPVLGLPSELLVPSPSSPSPSPATPAAPAPTRPSPPAPRNDPATFEALSRWRARGLDARAEGFSALRDQHLRAIMGSGLRSPEAVAKLLPSAALRERADEVVAILAELDSAATRPAPGPSSGGLSASSPRAVGEPAPAAAPPARPVPSPGASSDTSAAAGAHGAAQVDPADFDMYDLTGPRGEPESLTATALSSGGWSLRWAAPATIDPVVLYRVVSGDDYPPYAPDSGSLLEVTDRTTAVDERPFTAAVRHYQVWVNTGTDRYSAVHSQPRLHASSPVVGQVARAMVRADGGRVIGQWETVAGVRDVQVYRVPMELAARADLSPEFRIAVGEDNLGGFVDTGVTRGSRYLYLVCAAAEVDGLVRLSHPKRFETQVAAVLTPVVDLEVTQHDGGRDRSFDLGWTEPSAGRVSIYRTRKGPRSGAGNEVLDSAALPQVELHDEARLPDPIRRESGRARMHGVTWPDGWTRAYFTPVTELDGRVQVGATTSATFVPPVRLPRLVERVDRQVLTFAWPAGAASVVAFVAPTGVPLDAVRGGRQCEISERQYRDLGGLTFPFVLPERGCDVHLVPLAFAAGEKVEGKPVTVSYD